MLLTREMIMNNILVKNNKIKNYENEFMTILDNVIIFKKNCDCNVYYENCDSLNVEVRVLDNVYVKLFEYMDNTKIISNINYNISDNATLLLFKFYANLQVYENITVNLDGYMSKIDYHFSNISIGQEQYNFIIKHNNSNSISNISNKTICLNDGSIEFSIDTVVEKGNVSCNLNQDTRIVNLENNHCLVKPNMYISEDDVEARHASVIGNFSEEELFYLMSRGIDYNSAIKLLVKGYIFSNLVVDMDKRSKILNVINKYWR